MDLRTKTYNYISGTYLLAGVAGAALASLLLSRHIYLLNILAIICYALTLWVAMLIPTHCGRDFKLVEDTVPILTPPEDSAASFPSSWQPGLSRGASPQVGAFPLDFHFSKKYTKSPQRSLLRMLLDSWRASFYSLRTLFRVHNPTFTVVILSLINSLATSAQILLPQYTSLVLHWPLATVNAAIGLKSLVSAIILFSLPTIRRLYLEPWMSTPQIDLLITQASLLINLFGMLGLGVSASAGFFMASLCIFTSGTGVVDSLNSFGALSLPQGEKVTDFFLRIGLMQSIAGLVGAPLWTGIFSLVLKSGVLPFGFSFWLCAGLFGIALTGATVLKRWEINAT